MKKCKKILLIMPIILCSVLVGCSANKSDEPTPQDVNFVKDVEKAFIERSNYVEKVESNKMDVSSETEYLTECVNKELSILRKYKEELFSDATLRKLALDYIDGVEIQESSIKYYNNDILKYDELWKEGYDKRSTSMIKLVDDYGVKIPDTMLKEFRNNSQLVNEQNELESKISEMVKNINFEKTNDEYGYRDYTAVVENITDTTFDSFSLDVKLLDSDGVVIGTEYVYANNWSPGEKVKLEFMTSESFDKLEWDYEYFID